MIIVYEAPPSGNAYKVRLLLSLLGHDGNKYKSDG